MNLEKEHNPGLDLLRVAAITLVIFRHYPRPAGQQFLSLMHQWGWTGVDLFFVLSGYLISHQLLKPVTVGGTPSLSRFYIRRVFRILPAYWATVLAYYFVPFLREGPTMSPLWRFFSFTLNFGLDLGEFRTFSRAWSLCIEEHFYLILPLSILLISKSRLRAWTPWILISLVLAGVGLRAWIWQSVIPPVWTPSGSGREATVFLKEIYYPTYTHLDGLIVGLSIALIQLFRPKLWESWAQRPHRSLVVGMLGLVLSIAFASNFHEWACGVFGFTAFGLAYGCLVVSALSPGSLLSRRVIPGIPRLAVLAYTIYLTHRPVIRISHRLLERLDFARFSWVTTLATVAAMILVATILHELVERPFLNLRKRILRTEGGAVS